MKKSFNTLVNKLKDVCNRFDESNNQQKLYCISELSKIKLPVNKALLSYYEALLFICAYPPDKNLLSKAEEELLRMTSHLRKSKSLTGKLFKNSGLPHTTYVSKFSHDFADWLSEQSCISTAVHSFEHGTFDLNEVLKLTLPSVEKSETTAGFNNDELFEALLVKKDNQLSFLITELSKLNHMPYIKDHLFDGLGLYMNILPKDHLFSRAYNRLQLRSTFYHQALIKQFDHTLLLNTKLPEPTSLTDSPLRQAVTVVKNSMALTDRETDPTTYLDEKTFRLYELENGISIAIYGMIPQRQLPLESYVGYTLFKNGFPAAYGGGWLFGERSNFGINIFDSFRGGESGYIMCQLLRVYRQAFGVNYFEVEPYQFGLDNPEGISSGAFWFYYRYGFRPLDKDLLKISLAEHKKITSKKTYRTIARTLIKFTDSNIALNLGKKIPVKVPDITSKVIRMINKKYNGNRVSATNDCVNSFKTKTNMTASLNPSEEHVLQEVSLWAGAFDITDKRKLNLLSQMVKSKPTDLYTYQKLLLQFFNE